MSRVAIFVDVQNLYYTARQAFDCHIDYRALWCAMVGQDTVHLANAYAIERGDERQHQFQRILQGIGFTILLKPFIQRRDGSAKGDWDVGIALDAFEAAAEVERVVLATGDGDFTLLVERIRTRHAIDVDVFGVEALTAETLQHAASHFTPIEGALLLERSR